MFKKSMIALLFVVGLTFSFLPVIVPSASSWLETLASSNPVSNPLSSGLISQAQAAIETPAIPTPRPEEIDLMLPPQSGAAGWATSLDGRAYLAESEIHVGYFDGHTFLGALQFDLSAVPAGATITYASLELTGLDAQNTSPGGKWQLYLLNPAINAGWSTLSYDMLRRATTEIMVGPALTSTDLSQGQVNSFRFGSEQLVVLQSHLPGGLVSFRLEGPSKKNDNLFTWANGDGAASQAEAQPVLHLRLKPPADSDETIAGLPPSVTVGPSPTLFEPDDAGTPTATAEPPTATPLSPDEMVIVTSTPGPENIITVAALAATATKIATTVGTYTPVPRIGVTPIIVTPWPTPANKATTVHLEAVATAEAFLNGTATPTPPNVWTATPVLPTPSPTSSPNLAPILVTRTPTPENIVTVAAQAGTATAIATAVGTYTPVPRNWVVPVVVTPQPARSTPANAATAVFQVAMATAEAFLGTTTPLNVWTATPTPYIMPVVGEVATPWVQPTPTPAPQPIPRALIGKIAFLSNRSGGPEPLRRPLVYVVDPDGSNLSVLADPTFYNTALERDYFSADQRYRAFVKDFPRYYGDNGNFDLVPAIFYYDYHYNVEEQITFFGAGYAWDPVWSPTREQIAFVSNDSQDDEIWIVNREGTDIRRLTETNEAFNAREIGKDTFIPEVNGHPSWSPDGDQIVFWSNRTGHRQIWVMDVDGSNLRSLSTTGYDDWNPVWIKYADPARNPVPDIGAGGP